MQHNCFRVLSLLFLVAVALVVTGCNKLLARDKLNKGVQAFKAGQFDAAIEHFKQAKDLDPELLTARLYLASAYASQYIPGAPSDENIRVGRQAIAEFQEVLQKDPNNISAIDGIGSLLYHMAGTPFDPKKFEESKKYHYRHVELKPDDPEPYYWIGHINWTLAYDANRKMRAEYNSKARKPVGEQEQLPPPVREKFASGYSGLVEEGIRVLQKAIGLRPDYEDAMAYLNLLLRQKADQVASLQERKELLAEADRWVDKHREVRQKKSEAPATPTS